MKFMMYRKYDNKKLLDYKLYTEKEIGDFDFKGYELAKDKEMEKVIENVPFIVMGYTKAKQANNILEVITGIESIDEVGFENKKLEKKYSETVQKFMESVKNLKIEEFQQ